MLVVLLVALLVVLFGVWLVLAAATAF